MTIPDRVTSHDLAWSYDEPLSVHVVETDEGTVLFGGGSEETADALVEIATDRTVDAVVVEHGDADHYGGVPALRAAVPDLEVAVPAGDASFLEDAGIEVDHPLEPGVSYRGVEPIAAPGHTPDNMAYLYEDVLVAGDTVVGADSEFAAPGDWRGAFAVITPEFNAADERTRRSVAGLLEYDFDTVLVTHGDGVESGGRAEIETLVDDLDLDGDRTRA